MPRLLRIGLATAVFSLLWLFAGCTPQADQTIVVTEVLEVAGVEVVVTRIMEPTPTPTQMPVQSPAAPRLTVLDLGYTGQLPDLDPQQTGSQSGFDLVENLFAGLTNFNHETQNIEPELATAWRVSPDGRTWTFDLRDDIFWMRPDSGPPAEDQLIQAETIRPVVADDVVFAIRRACDRNTGAPDAFMLFIIEGCEAVNTLPEPSEEDLEVIGVRALDDTTLEFRLNQAASYFLTLTTLPLFHAVPPELIEEHGATWRDPLGNLSNGWQTPEYLMTSGPFLPVAGRLTDTEVTLHRNPTWPLPAGGNIDIVNIQFYNGEMATYADWSARQLDISPLPPEAREEFLARTPDKARLITDPVIFYLGFNFDSGAFLEPAVRRAFSAAIDRDRLIEELIEARGLGMRHFSLPDTFGAPPVNEVGVGYSPDFARQQMAGSSFRDCKLMPPFTILVSTADLSLLQAELIRRQWIDELGCDESQITLDQMPIGELLAATTRDAPARPDMYELAWPIYYPDAHNALYDLLHCENGENRQNRPCSEVDSLLRNASINPNFDERRELYRQSETLLFGENGIFPVIPLFVRGSYTVVQSWVDYAPALYGGEQFNTYRLDETTKRLERSRFEQ